MASSPWWVDRWGNMASIPSLHGKQMGKIWKPWQILFSWAPKSLWTVTAAIKLKEACSLEEKLWQNKHACVCAQLCPTPCNPMDYSLPGSSLLGSITKKQRHHFTNKSPQTQSYSFSSSHILMWELDHKEDWMLKNWYFGIVVLEKTFRSLLDWKEIKPVNPKGNQPWVLIGRTDAEVEAPILWPPDKKSRLIRKDSDARKDWRQK